jgi:hypothetical protein
VIRTAVAYVGTGPAPVREDLPDGLELIGLVDADRGVARALETIAAGEAGALFVNRLGEAAGSFGELIRLLDWLAAAGADLVAADVALDTATGDGERMVALLREIDSWGRKPHHPKRPRGRPGVASRSPIVAERIAEMRVRGMSLQAIADALNAEGVPTPRGGERWRPSSVQSAVGYQRPRPPVPGAPPPRRRGKPPKPPGPPKPPEAEKPRKGGPPPAHPDHPNANP